MSMDANGRWQDSQYDRGRIKDRPSGTRSAATFRKLPTDAPIKKAKKPRIAAMAG